MTNVTDTKPRKINKNISKASLDGFATFNAPVTINLQSFYHDYHPTVAEEVSFCI